MLERGKKMNVTAKRIWIPLCAIGFGLAFAITGCAKRAVTTQGAGATTPPSKVEQPAPSAGAARTQPSVRERALEEGRARSLEERTREQVAREIARGAGPGAGMPGAGMAGAAGMETGLMLIHFEFDKYTLSSESRDLLKKNAEWLRKNSTAKVLIEGHADERGTNEYNMALGEKRAHSARQYFIELGIPADRLSTISYGEERPADPRHNEEAWTKNRRDAFTSLGR